MVDKHNKVSIDMREKEISRVVAMDSEHSSSLISLLTKVPGKRD